MFLPYFHQLLADRLWLAVQYNPFGDLKTYSEKDERIFNDSNGSIIAISYGEARKVGVKRGMRGGEARKLCPALQLVQVPTLNGKADLTLYRKHGQDVLNILAEPDHAAGALSLLVPVPLHASSRTSTECAKLRSDVLCEKASICLLYTSPSPRD